MTQVVSSICKNLRLSIANLTSLVNISTLVLKKIPFEWSWQLPVFSVSYVWCWSTGLVEKKLFMQFNASAEIYTDGELDIKSVESFLVTGTKVAEQDVYSLTKICYVKIRSVYHFVGLYFWWIAAMHPECSIYVIWTFCS